MARLSYISQDLGKSGRPHSKVGGMLCLSGEPRRQCMLTDDKVA